MARFDFVKVSLVSMIYADLIIMFMKKKFYVPQVPASWSNLFKIVTTGWSRVNFFFIKMKRLIFFIRYSLWIMNALEFFLKSNSIVNRSRDSRFTI